MVRFVVVHDDAEQGVRQVMGKAGLMMVEDANLIWAWFGFVFLMLLFRAPFAAETIRMDIIRIVHWLRSGHLKILVDRHETHGRSPANI